LSRLKKAAAEPAKLSQQDIVKNLDVAEKSRLTKIRNIGIAVCGAMLLLRDQY